MGDEGRQTSRASTRVALAFAYDGTLFDSFARQPDRRTVEGELLRLLSVGGAIRDARTARYEVASRTDAGVSAAWNVCAFDAAMDPRRVAHLKNRVPGLWLRSAAAVSAAFSPRRSATMKRYVYHVPGPDSFDWPRMRAAAAAFVGQHDFRNYCRPDRGVPTRRTLSKLEVEAGRLVFEAPNFLWEQVRRITGALLAVGDGSLTVRAARRRLDDASRVDPQAAAPPEALVLEHVALGVDFDRESKSASARLKRERDGIALRARFYDLLASVPTERR